MKLLIDEMYPPAIAEQLRQRGHDAVAVKERLDLMKKDDQFLFTAAQMEGRALMTENFHHFQRLHLSVLDAALPHCGLIYTTERSFFRGDPRTIGHLIRALEALLTSDTDISGHEVWLRPI